MKKPLSVIFVITAILLGRAGAIDLDLYYPVQGNMPGSGTNESASDQADDPCLNWGSPERNERAESLLALSGFGIL